MTVMLEKALQYAERRLPVFPCQPRGKAPLTPNGLHDATTDPRRIRDLWARTPDANVAIRTGFGLVVLDVDGDEGADSLHDLERLHSPLPRTASVKTPRGGHKWFRCAGSIPNSAGRLGPGLDVRGDGGYVLVPPSIGANGRAYEPDEQAPIAQLPRWLHGLMAPAQNGTRRAEPASTWVTLVRDGAPEGQRNASLSRIVGHLLARDVDARLVAELAHLINTRNRPPVDSDEVDRVVASIAGRELRKRTGSRR